MRTAYLLVLLIFAGVFAGACSSTSTTATQDGGSDASSDAHGCAPQGMICCGGDYGSPPTCGPDGQPVCANGLRLVDEHTCYQPCDPRNPTRPASCDASPDAGDGAADGEVDAATDGGAD